MVYPGSSENSDTQSSSYWYARVIGIFHAQVAFGETNQSQQMDFLWVRWFQVDEDSPFSMKKKRLPRVSFVDGNEPCAFGFVDPADVVRAVHLIPAFNLGRTKKIMGESQLARKGSDKGKDWKKYYVGM
jgi:hypothetical protein